MNHTNTHTKHSVVSHTRGFPIQNVLAPALAMLFLAAVPFAHAATMSYTLSVSSDYSLLLSPNDPAVQNQVKHKSSAVVATANNNPVLDITNTSTTADISDIKVTLTDADSVFNALKVLQSPPGAEPQSPYDKSVWGGASKTIDIVLPTALAPNQSLTFAVNLGPLGGFPNMNWTPGFQNIFWQTSIAPNTNANLTVTYSDPSMPGVPTTIVTNVLPSLATMDAVTVASSCCCNRSSTSVFSTSFSTGPSVPEPASVVLVVLGSLPLTVRAWRNHKRVANLWQRQST